MAFHGQEKITLYMIFLIYTEVLVSLFMIPFWGFLVSILIIGISLPITLIGRKYYELVVDKKLNDEIRAIPFWSGLCINRKGVWRYVDFGIEDKEEIVVTDTELEKYQKEADFTNAIESMKQDPNNVEYAEMIEKSIMNDQYVDQELSNAYQTIGLCTSRQIYAFEMLRAQFEIGDKQLDMIIDHLLKIPDNAKDQIDTLNKFESIIYFLLKHKNGDMKVTTITNFLERILKELGVSEKILHNTELYGKNLVRLHDVEYMYREAQEEKSLILKNLIPTFVTLISIIFSIVLVSYVRTSIIPYLLAKKTMSNDLEIGMWTLYILCIIPIILSFFFTFWRIKSTTGEYNRPNQVIFKNIMTKRFAFENYCELRKKMREFSTDARIYKIKPMKYYKDQIWRDNDNEYVIVILPASYEDSLQFDEGTIPYKGYNMSVQLTPIVMLDIGTIMGNIPTYIMVSCTHNFKSLTKIFYTSKLSEQWLCKIYQYFIAKLQTRIQLLEPENESLKVSNNMWREWAVEISQTVSENREIQYNELLKTKQINPNSSEEYPQQQPPQQPPQESDENQSNVMNVLKKKNILIIILVIIVFVILFILIFGFIIPSDTLSNVSNTTTTTTK